MKKFEGLLFCTDLDGTLYSDDKTVSKENLEAIEYFKAEGGLFTFITGRVPIISTDICKVIKPNAPYGCVNGGGIYDAEKKEYIWNKPLSKDALELVKYVDKNLSDVGIQFNTEHKIYFNKDNSAMQRFRERTGVANLPCSYEELGEVLLKVVFAHTDSERINELKELLDRHPKAELYDFIRSERTLYEILPKGVSKGSVLLKLAELIGIEAKKTVAVGDYNNDVSMLRCAGLSFAVSNAVEEAKLAAKHVLTVSNNEHAIAAIIDGLDRGIYTV